MRKGCKLIFLSTTSVYGTQNDELTKIHLDEFAAAKPYAESKLKAELMRRNSGNPKACSL